MIRKFFNPKKDTFSLEQHDFLKYNIIFFIGTLSIAFFNYLYYPVISRLVSVSDFGEIQAWISLFMEFGIILTAFGYVITNIVRNHESEKKVLLIELERIALGISIVIFFILSILSIYLKASFQFTSYIPFVALGLMIVLNVPATFRTYYLQGQRRLKEVAISGVVFAVGKLLLTVLFLIMGMRLFGVICGYLIGVVATIYYLVQKTSGSLPSVFSSLPLSLAKPKFQTEAKTLKREVKYGLFILVLLFLIAILSTSDAIVVRRFFSPHDAGLFSGISSIGRIVYFITASVAGVLIATVQVKDSLSENRAVLRKSIYMILLIGGSVMTVFILFPELCVDILIGSKYASELSLLPWIGVSMLFASLNNLLFSYQIALRKFVTIIPAVLGIVLLIALIMLLHRTLKQVALDYAICNFVVFVVTLLVIYRQRMNHA